MSAVLQAIARKAASEGAQTAVSDGRSALSYADLHAAILQTAEAIGRRCPGSQPVASLLDNSPAWIILDLALLHLGRVHVPLPLFFSEEQRRHALASAGAGHLLVAAGPAAMVVPVAGINLSVVPLQAPAVSLPKGTAKITYTSGSTGEPKGVCLSQEMLEETAQSICTVVGAQHATCHLAVLPLAVLLENVAGLYAVLLAGGTYVAPPLATLGFAKPFAPDFLQMAEALRRMKASSAILVPELLRGLVMALRLSEQRLPDMRFLAVGGAAVPLSLLAHAADMGLPVYEGYGLSEAGSVVTLNRPGKSSAGSAGHFLPHVSAVIATDGELLIEHPVFLGYVGGGRPPSVLATGDIVDCDETGAVSIIGRTSNLIITSYGRNISPEWIERELTGQPVIRQALVHGDGAAGLSALIVPMGETVTDEMIAAAIAAANDRLPEYARLHHWRRTAPFTVQNGLATANGRMKRHAIHAAHRIGHFSKTQELSA